MLEKAEGIVGEGVMRRIQPLRVVLLLLWVLFLQAVPLPPPAGAVEEYALATGKACIFCHVESTGGDLKTMGFAYIRNGYRYPVPERIFKKVASFRDPVHKAVRFGVGYLHLLAAVVFFGAIFYIHIFVRPKRFRGGIPRNERILGVSCMAMLAGTGAYLTWLRIERWEQFFDNTFGLMLFCKIILFVVMVLVGLTAATAVNHLMKKEAREASDSQNKASGSDLSGFDGLEGRPAYIAYQGKVYDVTESLKWKDGKHFGKHAAGGDLTEALKGAPHGPEVLERMKAVSGMEPDTAKKVPSSPAHSVFVWMAYVNLIIVFLILACISVWRWGFPIRLVPEQRKAAVVAAGCIACHEKRNPGLVSDWRNGVHARVGVDCYKCHKAGADSSESANGAHFEHDPNPVSVVVGPKTCSGCHPKQVAQYALSKHARTREIMWKVDPWIKDGMNNEIERITGCFACHGTEVTLADGKPFPGTWPNVGVGRENPDGTRGSCSSCHTRHRFSVEEARKPESCGQCHLGPDHPQIEIYNESKHGAVYHTEGAQWSWRGEDGQWLAGRDYRAPTCAACHMSGSRTAEASHDVTGRLSWELQTALTVRPSDFEPLPSSVGWKDARAAMQSVCFQCHSKTWTEHHFSNLDAVVDNYDRNYFAPARERIARLYSQGKLSGTLYFDEPLEWDYYELWHHEGRRARMGAAMMAPDYAWWHGFYEVKHRFLNLMRHADHIGDTGAETRFPLFPGRHESVRPRTLEEDLPE